MEKRNIIEGSLWYKVACGKAIFQKKPLGRRWYLMSSPVKGYEFSPATAGTEREDGFDRISTCRKRKLETQ